MSGLEVIGGISAIISFLDASKKLYDSVQRDTNLPKTFQTIGSRLPVIRHTLETCETTLKLKIDSLPENVYEELDNLVYACQAKAKNLEEILRRSYLDQAILFTSGTPQLSDDSVKGRRLSS